ncbi:MAG: 2-amino-4-hydroxy-6-hydroxymethyldihydropteridine diphosphokinase [Bacteroidota bacterium]
MNGIYLLLGSNIDDRLVALKKAIRLLKEKDIKIEATSSIYETAPWGITEQNWFLNVGLKVTTQLNPKGLLEVCQKVEQELGRVRKLKWGPRKIDIDILYYDDQVINLDVLKVPHPGIPDRKFTLILLDEIAADEIHPIFKKTQTELLNACSDNSECRKTNYQHDIDLD